MIFSSKNSHPFTWRKPLLCLLVVILGACTSSDDAKTKKDDSENKDPIEIFAEPFVKTEIFDPRTFAGLVDIEKKSILFSAIEGVLEKANFKPGDQVKAGQVLYVIRPLSGIGFQKHPVIANMAGILVKSPKSIGQRVSLQDEIGVIAKLDKFQTKIHVTAEDIKSLKVGEQVAILTEGVSEGTTEQAEGLSKKADEGSDQVSGSITSVAQQPDILTGAYEVRVQLKCGLKDCKDTLKLGSFLKVCFKDNPRLGLQVKSKYLKDDQSKLLLVAGNNKARWIDIQTGSVFGEYVEVKGVADKFLNSGFKLVTGYSKRPKEGDILAITTKKDSLEKSLKVQTKKIASPKNSKGNKG